jgi:hypothetical protein
MVAVKLFVIDFFRVLDNYHTFLTSFIDIPLVGCIIGLFLILEVFSRKYRRAKRPHWYEQHI